MKYRIALPITAAAAALALAPAVASAAQYPHPSQGATQHPHPLQGSVTYTESLSRSGGEAQVAVTGGPALHLRSYRFVTQDPRHERYSLKYSVTDYTLQDGQWVPAGDHSRVYGPYRSGTSIAGITRDPGTGYRAVVTVESRTAGHRGPAIPVTVKGLSPVSPIHPVANGTPAAS